MSKREARNKINKAEHLIGDARKELDSRNSAIEKESIDDMEQLEDWLSEIREDLKPDDQRSVRDF